ncbi:MAG: hypothetical protein ACJ8F7_20670 [Gemmataceae bacterium]
MNVVAGENYATLNGQTSFNPEISRKRQFLNNAAANYQVIYNRTADVTQPRFRYGMLPAVDPQRVGNQEIARAQLAGVPDESPAPFGSQPYLQTFPTQPYLPLTLDLNHVNGITNADHQKYDNNDLVLSDVISFEVKVLWDTPISRKDPRLTQPHNFGTFGLGPNLAYSFTYQGQNYQVANSDYPYDYLPMSPLIPPQQQQPPQQPLPGYTGNLVFAGTAPQGLQPPAPGFSARVFDTWSQDAAAYGFQEQLAGVPPKSTPNWKRTDYPQDQLTVNATGTRVPLPIRVKSVLIRIRIWDQKAEQVRQITIIQDV